MQHLFKLFFVPLLLCIIFISPSYSNDDINQQVRPEDRELIEDFFSQMINVINSRDNKKISSFFNFYSTDNIEILKKLIIIDQDAKDFTIQDLEMSIADFINFYNVLFNKIDQYNMTYTILGIDQDSLGRNFNVSIQIDESIIYSKKAIQRGSPERSVVSANCNYSFSKSADLLKLYNSNCIEKIVSR